eukprot:604107_1
MDECGPAKHIYYFDTSKPNQSILNAEITSGMNIAVQIETCPPTAMSSTKTHTTADPVERTTFTPTSNPSAKPITASPTQPGVLICGDEGTLGSYTSGSLIFEATLPFAGDITFDASDSNFAVTNIEARTKLGALVGSDSDHDGVLVLTLPPGEYKFIMSGDAPGVYLATLDCTSNEPTLSPTRAPVDHPITPHPSAFPSAKPIAPSQAATTPSATHTTDTATPIISTFEPSKSPTKRPIKHTFVSSQAESTRETGENGDDNEQATGDNDSDSLRTIFYIMVSLMCFCCVCNCIVFGMKKNSNFMNDMKNVTRFWKQDIVTDNVIQITLSSNVHQVMSGEEEIGNGQCRKDRIGDGGGVQKSFNLQHIIYGASEGVMGEQKDQSDSEDLFR